MITPGFNCRTARYRLYVRLARELSRLGWATLRFDPHGIGDSDGENPCATVVDLYNQIERGSFADDAKAALDFLDRETGSGSAILLGLCGGAITTVRIAAADPRVAGIMPVELPLRYTLRPEPGMVADDQSLPRAEAEHFLRSYRRKILSPGAWWRFLTVKSQYGLFLRSLAVSTVKRLVPQKKTWDDAWFLGKLGPRANLSLISCFRQCISRGIPVLGVFGSTYNYWHFSEVEPGLLGKDRKKTALEIHSVRDADPGFSLPQHCEEFFRVFLGWLQSPARPWA